MSSLVVSSGGGTVVDGAFQVCPGITVILTCSHDSTGDLTRWVIGAPIGCSTVNLHSANPSDSLCGTFTINMISAMDQPTRMSTLVLPVDQSLIGAVVTCYAGGSTSDPQAGNLTIHVIGENGIQQCMTLYYLLYIGACMLSMFWGEHKRFGLHIITFFV